MDELLRKIRMTIHYGGLYALESSFNRAGLTLQNTTGNRMILCKLRDGVPVAESVAEDYIYIGNVNDTDRELSERTVGKICDFVLNAGGAPDTPRNLARAWRNGVRMYEASIKIVNEDVNWVAGEIICE